MNFCILNAFPGPAPTAILSSASAPSPSPSTSPVPIAADEREGMICEPDAMVAFLYGLSEPQLRHIFETFHVGWAYEEPLRAALKHFHAWRGGE